MNQKLQRVIREIERAKAKIVELQASLPMLEKQKTELENAEIIKVFRTANVAPEDFNAFVEACKANMTGDAPKQERLSPQYITTEDMNDDEE